MTLPFRFVAMSDPDVQTQIPFIYFHGQLEDAIEVRQHDLGWEWDAPDLVGVDHGIGVTDDLLIGTTDHVVYGVPARAFIWRVEGRLRGLIVAQSDEESLVYAEKKFRANARWL